MRLELALGIDMQRAEKWEALPDINRPCADISFNWRSESKGLFTVVLHFSRVKNGLAEDLELSFGRPLAVSWEDESWGLIKTPSTLPRCSDVEFNHWTHPALVIHGSEWRNLYANRRYSSNDEDTVRHYFLVAMNDLLHVLSEREPTAKWIPAQ